jgi:hypothetical protein
LVGWPSDVPSQQVESLTCRASQRANSLKADVARRAKAHEYDDKAVEQLFASVQP